MFCELDSINKTGMKITKTTNLPLLSKTPHISYYPAPTAQLTKVSIAELNPKNIDNPHILIIIFPNPTPAKITES